VLCSNDLTGQTSRSRLLTIRSPDHEHFADARFWCVAGSARHVHRSCLNEWRSVSGRNGGARQACEVCHADYRVRQAQSSLRVPFITWFIKHQCVSAQHVQSHMLTALGFVAFGMQTRPNTDRCPRLQVPPPRQTAGGPWLDNTVCGNVRGTLEVVAVAGACIVISAVRIVKPLPPPPPINLADLRFDD